MSDEEHVRREPCVLGEFCVWHHTVHGAEAEELRSGLEKIIEDNNFMPTRAQLVRLLDSVDARDSLATLETAAVMKAKCLANLREGIARSGPGKGRELKLEELIDDPLSAELAACGFVPQNRRELVKEWWEVHYEFESSFTASWHNHSQWHASKAEALKDVSARLRETRYRNIRVIHVRRFRKVKPEMTPMEAGRRFASCFGGSHRGAAFQALADSAGTPASGILAADEDIRRAVKSGDELADEYGFKPLSQAEHALAISKLVKGAP